MISQPTVIMQGERFGYVLELTGRYALYLGIAEGSLMGIIFILCGIGFLKYRNIQLRIQLLMIIMAQVTLILDGISYYIKGIHTFPRFTLSEIFGFLAVFYIFSNKIIEIKGINNQ